HDKGPTIALIYGTGLISQGGSAASPLTGNAEMSARAVTRAFRDAFRDADVRAILFRIDSPGGSAVASETIWREVGRARERGKPVIVSMGDTAGSGGYYVAAPADKIVAQPATTWPIERARRSPRGGWGGARRPRRRAWPTRWAAMRRRCNWPRRRPSSRPMGRSSSSSFRAKKAPPN